MRDKAIVKSTKTRPNREPLRSTHSDLIKLDPYAVSLWGEGLRPILLLKSQLSEEQATLAVPLNPLEAGVTLSQANKSIRPTTVHRAASEIFKTLDLKITRCEFEDVQAHKQYVRLYFQGHPKQQSIRLPAEDAMSLCLYLEIPIYATLQYMKESREMLANLEGLLEGKKVDLAALRRNQTYIQ